MDRLTAGHLHSAAHQDGYILRVALQRLSWYQTTRTRPAIIVNITYRVRGRKSAGSTFHIHSDNKAKRERERRSSSSSSSISTGSIYVISVQRTKESGRRRREEEWEMIDPPPVLALSSLSSLLFRSGGNINGHSITLPRLPISIEHSSSLTGRSQVLFQLRESAADCLLNVGRDPFERVATPLHFALDARLDEPRYVPRHPLDIRQLFYSNRTSYNQHSNMVSAEERGTVIFGRVASLKHWWRCTSPSAPIQRQHSDLL